MKININEQSDFKPFEIKIVIESKREAELMSSLFNLSWNDVAAIANNNRPHNKILEFSGDSIEIHNLFGGDIFKTCDKRIE